MIILWVLTCLIDVSALFNLSEIRWTVTLLTSPDLDVGFIINGKVNFQVCMALKIINFMLQKYEEKLNLSNKKLTNKTFTYFSLKLNFINCKIAQFAKTIIIRIHMYLYYYVTNDSFKNYKPFLHLPTSFLFFKSDNNNLLINCSTHKTSTCYCTNLDK